MQYLLMLYEEEAGWNKLTKAEQEQRMAAYKAYTEALAKAGVLKGSNRLQPSSAATTVRVANGKPQVLDGPSATPPSAASCSSVSRPWRLELLAACVRNFLNTLRGRARSLPFHDRFSESRGAVGHRGCGRWVRGRRCDR